MSKFVQKMKHCNLFSSKRKERKRPSQVILVMRGRNLRERRVSYKFEGKTKKIEDDRNFKSVKKILKSQESFSSLNPRSRSNQSQFTSDCGKMGCNPSWLRAFLSFVIKGNIMG